MVMYSGGQIGIIVMHWIAISWYLFVLWLGVSAVLGLFGVGLKSGTDRRIYTLLWITALVDIFQGLVEESDIAQWGGQGALSLSGYCNPVMVCTIVAYIAQRICTALFLLLKLELTTKGMPQGCVEKAIFYINRILITIEALAFVPLMYLGSEIRIDYFSDQTGGFCDAPPAAGNAGNLRTLIFLIDIINNVFLMVVFLLNLRKILREREKVGVASEDLKRAARENTVAAAIQLTFSIAVVIILAAVDGAASFSGYSTTFVFTTLDSFTNISCMVFLTRKALTFSEGHPIAAILTQKESTAVGPRSGNPASAGSQGSSAV